MKNEKKKKTTNTVRYINNALKTLYRLEQSDYLASYISWCNVYVGKSLHENYYVTLFNQWIGVRTSIWMKWRWLSQNVASFLQGLICPRSGCICGGIVFFSLCRIFSQFKPVSFNCIAYVKYTCWAYHLLASARKMIVSWDEFVLH